MLQVDHMVGVIGASRGLVHRPDHVFWADSSENRRGNTRKSTCDEGKKKKLLKEQFFYANLMGFVFVIGIIYGEDQ